MDKYRICDELGDGTCGTVYRAVNIETKEIVAVKKMKRKFYYWEECMNLREVKSLRRLNHPNIITLLEIVSQNSELFFIFEYMEHNLYQIMKYRQTSFSEEEIRGFMSQVLKGLAHVHKNGYFHRDLKPENLLVTNDLIKIADFGLAREFLSSPPFTDYVSTRWYRAPEVLLRSSYYTPAVDMWAVGAIMAELFTLSPVFPGESEMDQLYKICCVLGLPDWEAFPDATNFSLLSYLSYSDIRPAGISAVIPNASFEAMDLIKQLFSWDPLQRPSADECLRHPFFNVTTWVPRPLSDTLQLNLGSEPNLELNLGDFYKKKDKCYLGLTLALNSSETFEMTSKCHCAGSDVMVYPGVIDNSQESGMWSLFQSNYHMKTTAVEPSLSLSFSSVPNTSTRRVPPSSGFALASFQYNI